MSDEFDGMTNAQIMEACGVEEVTDRERHGTGLIGGTHDANGNRTQVVEGDPEPEFDPARLASGQKWSLDGRTVTLVDLLPADADLPLRWSVVDAEGDDGVMAPAAFAGWTLAGFASEAVAVEPGNGDKVTVAAGRIAAIGSQTMQGGHSVIGMASQGRWLDAAATLSVMEANLTSATRGARAALRLARGLAIGNIDDDQRIVLAALEPLGLDRAAWVGVLDLINGAKAMSRTIPPQHAVDTTSALAAMGLVEVRDVPDNPAFPMEFRLTEDGWSVLGKPAP